MKIFEQILSLNSVEKIEKCLEKYKVRINSSRSLDEGLFIEFINNLSKKVINLSEAIEYNGQIIPLAKYGYWVLPDGSEIEINDFQGHGNYSKKYNLDVYQAIEQGWVRVITDSEFIADYNPEKFTLKQFNAVVELLKDNDAFRGYTTFMLGDAHGGQMFYDMQDFISTMRKDAKINPKNDSIKEEKTLFKNLVVREKLDKLVFWIKNTIDKNKNSHIEDLIKLIHSEIQDRNLSYAEVNRYFKSVNGLDIEQYLDEKFNIVEGISNITALKTRNDLVSLIKKFIDSSNVVPVSNFESSEQQDITLRVSVFNSKSKKLEEIKNHLKDVLVEQGWLKHKDTFKKDMVKITLHDIKKVFRSGAYQNREMPHFGIEIEGPKKLNG